MARSKKARPDLALMPMLPHESLYIGVDVGKFRHVAGFLSRTLLQRHAHFEGCPTFPFGQSRDGFRAFVDRIREYTSLEQATVLLEHTGHYHKNLEQYLLELDVTVYRIHVQERPKGMMKTDKRDALSLANQLYIQLELGAQVADKLQLVRRTAPPTPAAAQLRGFMQHRYELSQQCTQLRNKLTAICDEMAMASLAALRALRHSNFPSEANLLAGPGDHWHHRLRSLKVEQELLIKELRLVQEHLARLNREISDIVKTSREGQILLPMPAIGEVAAAPGHGNVR